MQNLKLFLYIFSNCFITLRLFARLPAKMQVILNN
jgi:hypothetical protein